MRRRDFLKTTSIASSSLLVPIVEDYNKPFSEGNPTDLFIMATDWGFKGDIFQFCEAAKNAGYDGIEVWVPTTPTGMKSLSEAVVKNNLKLGLLAGGSDKDFMIHKSQFQKGVESAISLNPVYINCHSGKDYFAFEQNKELVDFTIKRSSESNVPIYHETHRGRMLFAAHISKNFIEKIEGLRLTLDISHWCNVHESLLTDQKDTIDLALSRTNHIHARIGHAEGPQVNDPRAPEWADAVKAHFSWWDQVVKRRRAEGKFVTFLTEFGPPNYLQTLPYTNQPVANQWDINVYMMQLLRKRYS
jgi:sugar phosphate isomerase/epimerase